MGGAVDAGARCKCYIAVHQTTTFRADSLRAQGSESSGDGTVSESEVNDRDDSERPAAAVDDHGENEPRQSTGGDKPREIGGRGGLDPTRYGDWEKAGRCIDF